ncbi:MAG: sigma-70 family RNA polymerase sigma factor [Thermoleophilia bacterium]|nr:sigma-70 family RNA polymerase sigma factor [Thermoleophilia bacterium]
MSFPPTQGIIRSLSRRYDPDGHSREELGAAARLGLIEALRRFEPAREVKFTTYAYIFVRSEVLRSLYSQSQRREWRAGRPRIAVVPLQAMSVDGDESEDVIEGELASRDESFGVETGYAAAEKRPSEEAVRHFVAELPENQRKIVHDVFWDEMSHTEAAECRGITRPAVSRTLHRVFKRGRRELGEHVEVLAA